MTLAHAIPGDLLTPFAAYLRLRGEPSGGESRLRAGAGVVADSQPDAEDGECLPKLAVLEKAIDVDETECVA
ncbi:MAG: hypothetical protein K0S82_360 [Gaiellaceae bacterium]|jgi:anthranilate/para-aminobenzoate synthase component I|nr:hypothetical protein [Gaiellaceae bacterium]